ncbi:unnamed protein product [Tuwongella immobilis]|uniref:Uncharacterized protein n=1 Tax=Tuwongella immobilis TaxID=692036 RepID=A0A6C2YSM2_9BACT|nr:unnamed protein product [Tuwongella immobilis]VTS06036.1 unnamed protein product [Tuwongella immobilis]
MESELRLTHLAMRTAVPSDYAARDINVQGVSTSDYTSKTLARLEILQIFQQLNSPKTCRICHPISRSLPRSLPGRILKLRACIPACDIV